MTRLLLILTLWLSSTVALAAVYPEIWVTGKLVDQSPDKNTYFLNFLSYDDILSQWPLYFDKKNGLFAIKVYPKYSGTVNLQFYNYREEWAEGCLFSLSVDQNLHGKMQLIQEGQSIHCKLEGDINDDSLKIVINY